MSREMPIVSSHDDIWEMIPAEYREEWSIRQAVNDAKIQAVFELFATHNFNEFTVDYVKDGLEELLEDVYAVPRARSEEVFSLVEEKIKKEMEDDNGQT